MNDAPSQPMKRKLLGLLALLPWLSACSVTQPKDHSDLVYKFRGIRGVEVVTSSSGRHRHVTITTESGRSIAAPALLARGGGGHLFFTGKSLPIPRTVRIIWREGVSSSRTGPDPWLGGTVVGDYTIQVAARIPDEVIDDVRKDGGKLRIKFRLVDDGVLLGWDIERRPGYDSRYPDKHVPPQFDMAGGDFQEALIFGGQVIQKGWYIDKNGQKIETDF